jgi:putative lipoic acid-binding regulatory protein
MNKEDQPRIEYPCFWEYKIIGTDEIMIKDAAANILADRTYDIIFSKTSRSGKYQSFSVHTL